MDLHSQQQPSPWDCSTNPKLQLPTAVPSRGPVSLSRVCMDSKDSIKDCLILNPFRLPQISCFTIILKCFSSDSDSRPDVWIGPVLQFPHPLRAGPVLVTLLFFPLVPSPYWVLSGSIYSFLLVRYSCLLLAGVLHALLCLKEYSWCICEERCTACPPIPPSCSPADFFCKVKRGVQAANAQKTQTFLMAFREKFLKTGWGRGFQSAWSAGAQSYGRLVVK